MAQPANNKKAMDALSIALDLNRSNIALNGVTTEDFLKSADQIYDWIKSKEAKKEEGA